MSRWRLAVARSAERGLSGLPAASAAAVVEFMTGPLLEDPSLVGKPLQRELAGYWSARRGAYRIIYRLEPEQRTLVVRIEHRYDVYRRR